jgi:hypothetical protein
MIAKSITRKAHKFWRVDFLRGKLAQNCREIRTGRMDLAEAQGIEFREELIADYGQPTLLRRLFKNMMARVKRRSFFKSSFGNIHSFARFWSRTVLIR